MRSALAAALGIFGSIDMNRNDYQSGWDTDQFPNNHAEKAVAFYEILKAGGFTTGGTNFDAKIRRQSLDPEDLILAHVGGMDTCARALKSAAALMEEGEMEAAVKARYAGWNDPEGAGDAERQPGRRRRPRDRRKASNRSRSPAGRSGWRTSGTATSDRVGARRTGAPHHSSASSSALIAPPSSTAQTLRYSHIIRMMTAPIDP